VTLITLSPFGRGRAAPTDSVRGRGKGTSAYSSSYNEEIATIARPVSLPKIRPERHRVEFLRAMARAEKAESLYMVDEQE
jgi:hypothetical protein